VLVLVVFVAGTALALGFVLRRLLHDLREITPPLEALADGRVPPPLPHADAAHPFEQQVAAFNVTVTQASASIAELEHRLDENRT
jgi:hypothetical protein